MTETIRGAARAAVLLLITFLLVPLSSWADEIVVTDARGERVRVEDASRIVSLGSAVTEILAALGRADLFVGVDASSSYPEPALAGIPRTGYVREVAAEGILSLDPTVVLASTDVGPPEVVEQIEDADVPVVVVPEDDSVTGVKRRVRFIARVVDAEERAQEISDQIDADVRRARALVENVPVEERASVLFVYARGAGTVMVSGTDTSAHAMIELAGGVNAMQGFSGYRPLTPEAALAAEPDYLLFFESGLESLGGMEGLASVPGIAQTRAYQAGRVLSFNDVYLLGFGPRVGSAMLDLARALYPETEAR
ncbi:MAG: heme/hemin ABC transporter substrate-binding protein [Spirochaetota bacterium]